MNALCLIRYSKWASVGLLLSVITSAFPVRAATFGFIPLGLESVDDYQQIYVANVVQSSVSNPIGEYHSSVTEAVNENTPGIDTPFEQALAAAGYNPTIIRGVIARMPAPISSASFAFSDEAIISVFEFDETKLSHLINDAEASNLSFVSSNKSKSTVERYDKPKSTVERHDEFGFLERTY